VRLRGLDPAATYRVRPWPSSPGSGQAAWGGDELMTVGLAIEPADPPTGVGRADFSARLFDLEAT